MRFYDLKISDPTSGQVWKPTPTGNGFTKSAGGSTFSSLANGKSLPGALNLEFDIPVYSFDAFQGGQYICIWGVGLGMVGQAANLNGANFSLSAGMAAGLPLATAAKAQAGLVLQGTVFQAFGNWQGVNQTLDLICNPGAAGPGQDIMFTWPAGTSLQTAIATTLAQAFPKYTPTFAISSALLTNSDEKAHYTSLSEFSGYLQALTQKLGIPTFGSDYAGVRIAIAGNGINVFDGTSPPKTISLQFRDLIGQPTWIGPAEVSFKTVLRSDIALGSQVKFPAGIQSPYALTSAAAALPNAPASSKTAFQGTFVVREAHHFGHFRQADADSWATAFTAFPVPAPLAGSLANAAAAGVS